MDYYSISGPSAQRASHQPSNVFALEDTKQYFTPTMRLKQPLDKVNAVVLFYRDGCPHCDNYKPVFAEAAARDNSAMYLTVNTAEEPYVMDLLRSRNAPFSIQGVPTIVSYHNGKFFSKFGADRTVDNTIAYAQSIGTAQRAYKPGM